MSAAAVFEERVDPGKMTSALLSAAVHLVLLAVLIFGVSWQNRPPETVSVELWEPPPPPAAPVVEAPKPLPKVEPPPPVVVKPEPEPPKPEIVEKKAPPPPKPKPVARAEPKVEPKPAPKPVPVKPVAKAEPLKPRVDETKRFQEELQREQASLAIDRERQQLRDQAAREASAASNKAIADWVSKVRAKIRGNVVLPQNINGNPEAVFDVVQLPNGDVLQAKLRKSSGYKGLDDAIERAILKSSPLPKPDKGESAPRAFELKYRPLEP